MMPPNSPSDGLSHDQEALPPFELFYDRYHMQVYRYLHAHLKHEQDAADLMQQVFFQAWNCWRFVLQLSFRVRKSLR